MSNWKEKRNYWKVKDCHGKVISHIIKIGDQQIEVSEEVFAAILKGIAGSGISYRIRRKAVSCRSKS